MHRPVALFALLCAALSACGKEAPKADTTPVAQTGAAAATPAAAYDPATHTLTVIARDFAFQAPDSIPAGWTTLRLVNEGPSLHHLVLVRLDSGKTVADFHAAMQSPNAPPPAWAVTVPSVNAPDPKSSANATTDLVPGNYVMLCFVDIPDHAPHFTKGMVRPLTVTAAAGGSAQTAPTADVVIALKDYAFTVSSGSLSAGTHTIQVKNDGPQEHELELVKLAPGKTMKDLGAWFAKPEGPPPGSAIGGVVGVMKGSAGYFTVDLSAGNYAFVCFVPDAKDKKAHVEHGMVKEFTVQ
jgi:uncharacterized cupredoxin-like copper-binding protein